MIRPGRKPQAVQSPLKEAGHLGRRPTESPDLSWAHLTITSHSGRIPKPVSLQGPGFINALSDSRALPPDFPTRQILEGDPSHRHVEVDPIKKWSGDPVPIPCHERGIAGTPVVPVSEEAARTRVHGSYQNETGRKPQRDAGSGQDYAPVLERLPKGLQDVPSKLW